MYEWDAEKAILNLSHHGVSFDQVVEFEWSKAIIIPDKRHEYGESRFIAMAPIDDRLYVLVYTPRINKIRVISFRKANRREVQIYVKNQIADEE